MYERWRQGRRMWGEASGKRSIRFVNDRHTVGQRSKASGKKMIQTVPYSAKKEKARSGHLGFSGILGCLGGRRGGKKIDGTLTSRDEKAAGISFVTNSPGAGHARNQVYLVSKCG